MCHKPSAKGGTCRSCSIYVVDVVKQEEEKMKNQFFFSGESGPARVLPYVGIALGPQSWCIQPLGGGGAL